MACDLFNHRSLAVMALFAALPKAVGAQPAVERAPSRLAVGTEGTFAVSANLTAWFVVSRRDTTQSFFRIRRAELRARGDVVPDRVGYQVMFDGAKLLRFTDTSVPVLNQTPPPANSAPPQTVVVPAPPADTAPLQDFFITFFGDWTNVSLGQFKIPVSYEGIQPSTQLLFPERALVSRYYGDRRDIGIEAEKKRRHVGYVLGVFDGQGPNQLDSNLQKDVALRLEAYPLPGLVLAAAGTTSVGQRRLPGTKDRAEADLRAEAGPVVVQAEYIHGWDRNPSSVLVESHGAYAALAVVVFDPLQVAARAGFLDPDLHSGDTTAIDAEQRHYEVGLNLAIPRTGVRFQLGYALFQSGLSGTPPRHELTLSGQVAF